MVSRDAALAGLVLCGGGSRRMGADKALLPIAGVPLFLHVARRLAEVADPVVLAPGTLGRLGATGYPEVADAGPGEGPLGGLVAGLAASPRDHMAVVACDMPCVHAGVLQLISDTCRSGGWEAAVALTDDGLQPLHAVYAASALPTLRAALAGGTRSLRAALTELRVRVVGESEWRAVDRSGRFAANVNSPADLAALAAPR
jgi:molybdopterin-guanine dinucleotide biosynthesis protein A